MVEETLVKAPICGNCLEVEDSSGFCANGCWKKYKASCYDCGMLCKPDSRGETLAVHGTEHFALHDCPGFQPYAGEWADGFDDPRYQQDRDAFWADVLRLRKEYAASPRPTSYPCTWCMSVQVKEDDELCEDCEKENTESWDRYNEEYTDDMDDTDRLEAIQMSHDDTCSNEHCVCK